jgi:hypothetical protein
MSDFKHVEEQTELLRGIRDILTEQCGHYDEWQQADKDVADRADKAADTMQELLDVAKAADKCKNGCRRCDSFERYPNLRDALAKLQEQNDD